MITYKELCRSRRVLSAEADNTLRDLHNSSYHTKAEFNNCFIIHSKYFQSSKNIQNFFNSGVVGFTEKSLAT